MKCLIPKKPRIITSSSKKQKRLIGELTTHTKDGSFLLRFFFRKNIWTEFVDIFHSNYNIESLTTQQG